MNSYHHQGIDRIAPGLTVTATAPDGMTESLRGDGLLGVQWHPEMLLSRFPEALAPFRALLGLLGVSRA